MLYTVEQHLNKIYNKKNNIKYCLSIYTYIVKA